MLRSRPRRSGSGSRQRAASASGGRRPWYRPPPCGTTADRGRGLEERLRQKRNGSSLTHALHKALHATGLRPLRWHDPRAIHSGLLVQAGVGMTTARDRLGHSSIAVTSTFYAGAVDELEREAAEKVGKLLGT